MHCSWRLSLGQCFPTSIDENDVQIDITDSYFGDCGVVRALCLFSL